MFCHAEHPEATYSQRRPQFTGGGSYQRGGHGLLLTPETGPRSGLTSLDTAAGPLLARGLQQYCGQRYSCGLKKACNRSFEPRDRGQSSQSGGTIPSIPSALLALVLDEHFDMAEEQDLCALRRRAIQRKHQRKLGEACPKRPNSSRLRSSRDKSGADKPYSNVLHKTGFQR